MGCCLGKQTGVADAQRLAAWKSTGIVSIRDSKLKALPVGLIELGPAVRTLDLTFNRIVELPPDMNALSGLQRLLLAENKLQRLPICIGGLQSLKFLVLDFNNLKSLPPEIADLPRLEKLSVSGNALTALPETFGGLQKLTLLDISRNKIQALPLSIGGCTALQELDAHDNLITDLPRTMGALKQLKSFMLDQNPNLQELPNNLLLDCVALQTLSLHGTLITVETLEKMPGYEDYEERRRRKHTKQIAGNAMMTGMDDGIDHAVRV